MADQIQDKLEQNALGPKRVRGDSAEIEQHSIDEQIKADKYLASKKATAKGRGFTLRKFAAGDGL